MVARLQSSPVFLRRRVDARFERSLAQALREPPRRGQAACDIAVYVFLFADKRLVGIIGIDAYRFFIVQPNGQSIQLIVKPLPVFIAPPGQNLINTVGFFCSQGMDRSSHGADDLHPNFQSAGTIGIEIKGFLHIRVETATLQPRDAHDDELHSLAGNSMGMQADSYLSRDKKARNRPPEVVAFLGANP